MNYHAKPSRGEPPSGISSEEWELRCDLAACYQLVDLYGWSNMSGNHISARLPGPGHRFLLNRYGMFYDEITASSLITVDVDGNVIDGPQGELNPAGFVIHSAVHMACPDLICAMHTHTRNIGGVAMQKEGLLLINQHSCMISPFLRYHDFEGAPQELDERQRIVEDFGPHGRIMILRNHGGFTVGRSVAEAFIWMYFLEIACHEQIKGLTGGRDLNWLSPEIIEYTANQGKQAFGYGGHSQVGTRDWPALIRKLERERGTSYAT